MTIETALTAGLFVAAAIISRRIQGSWMAPGAFFAMYWAVAVILALGIAPDVQVETDGLVWICACVVVVTVASTVGMAAASRSATSSPSPQLVQLDPILLRRLVIVLSCIASLTPIVLLLTSGYGLGSVLSISGIAGIERDFSIARYLHDYQEPLAARLLLVPTYLAPLLGGLLLASERAFKRQLVAFVSLMPALAVGVVETTKAGFIISGILMSAGYFSACLVDKRRGDDPRRDGRVGAIVGVLAVAVGLLFTAVQLGRYGYSSSNLEQVTEVVDRLRLGAVGYLGVFTPWFHAYQPGAQQLTFGASTFAGLFEVVQPRRAGIYSETLVIGSNGAGSNIYTIFRGLIEDFGLAGSMFFLTCTAGISGVAYVRVKQARLGWLPITVAFMATTLWSTIVNLFVYNSILVAWVLFSLFVLRFSHTGASRNGTFPKTVTDALVHVRS